MLNDISDEYSVVLVCMASALASARILVLYSHSMTIEYEEVCKLQHVMQKSAVK